MNIKDRVKKIKNSIPAVFIALKKKETPIIAKIFALITIGYALSPIDLIPDFIPVLGCLDDIIILPMLITLTVKLIPKDIYTICYHEAENINITKKWYYAVPIIVIWLIIIILLIKSIV